MFLEKREKSVNPFAEWEFVDIPSTSKYIYFEDLLITPIHFTLSFNKKVETAKADSVFFFSIMTNALGTAITNIDEAPIKLNGFKYNYIFDNKNGKGIRLNEPAR